MTHQTTNNIITNTNIRLSVQITLTGLSFLVTHAQTKETTYFTEKKFDTPRTPEELLIELEAIFSTDKALQQNFDDVNLVYAGSPYTLVPAALFDENKLSDYLKFNTRILANDFIAFDNLDNYDIKIVYIPWVNINNYLFDKFGSFQYYNAISILLKLVMDAEKYSPANAVYIHVLSDSFDLLVMKNGKLELCNSYPFKTPEDLIYYILFSFEQLNLNPDTLDVKLFGKIDVGDSNYEIIYKYVRHVSFPGKEFLPKSEIKNEDAHHNVVLKSL